MNPNFKCKCMYDNIEQISLKIDVLMFLTVSLMVLMLIPSQLYYNRTIKQKEDNEKEDDEKEDDEKDNSDEDEKDDSDEDDKDDENEKNSNFDETNTEDYNEVVVKNKEYDETSEIVESINIGCSDLACVNINNNTFCSESCKNTAILNGYIMDDDINYNNSNLELKEEVHKKLYKVKLI